PHLRRPPPLQETRPRRPLRRRPRPQDHFPPLRRPPHRHPRGPRSLRRREGVIVQEVDDYESRFGGIARLYGRPGLGRLRAAHVCIIGVGGVGAWTVEALARSGVDALTMIDLDI